MTKPLSGRNFLIVDDSTDNQTLFSRFLKLAGGNVTLACDGRAGLDAFFDCRRAGQTYDAVIMDIRMPVMDGYEASRRLREAGYNGPIIALTAHAVPGEEARCLGSGCSHFLTKPIDRVRFSETVFRAVDETDRSA